MAPGTRFAQGAVMDTKLFNVSSLPWAIVFSAAFAVGACGGSISTGSGDPASQGSSQGAGDNGDKASNGSSGALASSGATGSNPDGTSPPRLPPTETDEARLAIDASVERIEVSGEFLGAVPKKQPGDACEPRAIVYRIERATGEIVFRECLGDIAQHSWVEESRALTSAELSQLEGLMATIRYDAVLPCDGYDGPLISMVTTDKVGKKQLYVHQNINCPKDDRRRAPLVKSLYFALAKVPRLGGQGAP